MASSCTRRDMEAPCNEGRSAARSVKRGRTDADAGASHALVSCFDECDRYVEVDIKLLRAFNCRLYHVISYDPPDHDASGRPFWRSKMTRAMLTSFIRSLEHGELSLGKNVGVAEAMTTFEYENVPIGVRMDGQGEVALLRQPAAGVAFQKRAEWVRDVVLRTSEQIAHAIARWPRLEASLDAAVTGFPVSSTCTATRAWVRFCKKPQIVTERCDNVLHLARKWPSWIQATLVAFGIMRSKLIRDEVVSSASMDEAAFRALETSVMGDALGWLFATPHDWPRHAMDKTARSQQLVGALFADKIRNAILEASAPKGDATTSSETDTLRYARACISLAESLLHQSPSPTSMFAGTCCDDQAKSPERIQLGKSLQQRGIRIVRWSDGCNNPPPKPLIFPSAWSDGPHSGSALCSVLLDFSDRR